MIEQTGAGCYCQTPDDGYVHSAVQPERGLGSRGHGMLRLGRARPHARVLPKHDVGLERSQGLDVQVQICCLGTTYIVLLYSSLFHPSTINFGLPTASRQQSLHNSISSLQ